MHGKVLKEHVANNKTIGVNIYYLSSIISVEPHYNYYYNYFPHFRNRESKIQEVDEIYQLARCQGSC